MANLYWKEILGWSPDLIQGLRCSGYSYMKEGKYDLACVYFEGLVAIDGSNLYDLRMLGGIHLYLGNSKKALVLFNQALQIDPYHYPTLLNRAKALFLLGERKEAIAAVRPLQRCPDKEIANDAQALLLAYR